MSDVITIPAPPSTVQTAANILSFMYGQSGVISDYNVGAQIRTISEAIGSVDEMQGVASQAQALQAIVYSAYTAFGIYPITAAPAVGFVTFNTGTGITPPLAAQSVAISAGTIVQTVGGVQFQTTQSVVLLQGSTSITAPIVAVLAGIAGNVLSGTITQIVTGLPYALFCSNSANTSGGANAEPASATFARFTAAVAAIGLSTPVSVANSCIAVTVSGTGETVKYSTCFEPWIQQIQNNQSPTPGFTVFVDNGSGAASPALLAATSANLSGVLGTTDLGFRPAGVPYTVQAVTPLYSSVVVSGVVTNPNLTSTLTQNVISAIQNQYNVLSFGQTLQLSSLTAAVANAMSNADTSLAVVLYNASGISVSGVTAAYNQRNINQSYTVNIT